MDTRVKKDSYIKVRVSKEQKELFKRVAELKGITMTDLLVVGTEERALKEELKLDGTELLAHRIDEVEQKLQEIKCKMECQRTYKKSFFKIFLNRFMNLT